MNTETKNAALAACLQLNRRLENMSDTLNLMSQNISALFNILSAVRTDGTTEASDETSGQEETR